MEISPEFENNVKKWVLLDNKIKNANEIVRNLKKEKIDAGDRIMGYIQKNRLEKHPINITGGKICVATKKTAICVNRKYVHQRLAEYFKSETKADEITAFIYDNREVVEQAVLRRSNMRGK